ncbi:hypothetical protein [Microbacterium binotii]|uniref:Uncharacterized protein n=1 Tax=Microbacterium binotii TaxID=462710 RepID=A0ABP6BX01_9MICO
MDLNAAAIPGLVETFFGYLAAGDSGAAVRMTDLPFDESARDAPFIDDAAYQSFSDRPTLREVGEPQVSDDGNRADVDVTYAVGESERTESIELEFVKAANGVPDHWVFLIDTACAGFDASDASLLPDGTRYSVNGVDVTAAFSNLAGASPRVMAFAGTYPIEVAVAGEQPATVTITIDVDTLFRASDDDGKFRDLAAQLGVTR